MISFVIPCFNEEDFIDDCLKAIVLATQNTPCEIIVVDNGSTDSTVVRARMWGVRVISESIKGVTRARQAGLKDAKHDLVAFIDADGQIPDDWVKYALRGIEGAVCASGPIVYADLILVKRLVCFIYYCVAMVAHQMFPFVQGGNFILRKEAFLQVGGFDTSVDFYGEDTATAVRLSKIGKVRFDFDMVAFSSGRRVNHEGLFLMGARYGINYLWMWLVGKPWSTTYRDIRAK